MMQAEEEVRQGGGAMKSNQISCKIILADFRDMHFASALDFSRVNRNVRCWRSSLQRVDINTQIQKTCPSDKLNACATVRQSQASCVSGSGAN